MSWTLDSSGTKTPQLPTAATFTNGSATITVTNSLAVGDRASLQTTGALPTNFTAFANLWVVAATGTTVQLSATQGGTAITAGSAGSGTQTLYPEHVLATSTSNATFGAEIDLSAMTYGDLADFNLYTITLSGGAYGKLWKCTAQNIAATPKKQAPATISDIGVMLTLRQLTGTARAYPWKLLRQ